MADIEVELVATAGKLWSGTARMVSAKAGEGEIGILAGHTPLLAILASGEVRVTGLDGRKITASAADGFLSRACNRKSKFRIKTRRIIRRNIDFDWAVLEFDWIVLQLVGAV